MPLRPFGFPTFSVKSRFLVEMMIMEAAKIASGVDPTVLERVRDVFTTRLYGPGTAEGRPRPLIRLSIVEIETLQMIALDVCSDHPNDPDAAQEDVAEKLRRKRSGRTIFGLVDGAPIETLGRDIIMHGRTVLTDPEACVPPCQLPCTTNRDLWSILMIMTISSMAISGSSGSSMIRPIRRPA